MCGVGFNKRESDWTVSQGHLTYKMGWVWSLLLLMITFGSLTFKVHAAHFNLFISQHEVKKLLGKCTRNKILFLILEALTWFSLFRKTKIDYFFFFFL